MPKADSVSSTQRATVSQTQAQEPTPEQDAAATDSRALSVSALYKEWQRLASIRCDEYDYSEEMLEAYLGYLKAIERVICTASPENDSEALKIVAVLAESGFNDDLVEPAADVLLTYFSQKGEFRVMTKGEKREILQ